MESLELNKLHDENCRLAQEILYRADTLGITIGTAESCTGGLIASIFTEIPGSSTSFVGGIVSYWASIKEQILHVDPQIIETYGVVSEQTAQAMALGAQAVLNCDYAIATTGIAGPTGAIPGKPVGTVCFCIAGIDSDDTFTTCKGSSRSEVRHLAVNTALLALQRTLD